MNQKLPFVALSEQQQKQAISIYPEAGVGDGYVYELNADAEIYARQLCWSAYAPVDRKILTEALELMISLEPVPNASGMTMSAFQEILEKSKVDIEKAKFIMRQYGHKIGLEGGDKMRKEYEDILSSYAADPIKHSVVSSQLTSAWDGIGDWKM